MSDRLIELRVENQRLKQQVESLEQKVLSLVGMTSIESSGGVEKKNVLNDHLMSIIYSTQEQLNIVSPLIDKFYATELKNLTKKGVAILIITNDRGAIPAVYQEVYDDLKSTSGIKIINNPNVRYLLVFNSREAVYSGGSMDKDALEKSILIVTIIREPAQLRKLAEIFSLMLPSFMRAKKV
jgi:phosphatidylserine/phosphatidylglycerophosphate/cardiolipin synthase-like enzyme